MPSTIMVVEDHDLVRTSLQSWLEVEFPQCRVVAAPSGEEAVSMLSGESPRVVVMDIILQGMSST